MAPELSEWGRSGASHIISRLIVLGLLILLGAGCGSEEEVEERRIIELAEDTIRLEPGVRLTDILVRSGSSTGAPFEPDAIHIRIGDVVRFITADRHPHAIAFEMTLLAPAMETFLRETSQLRSPPLIAEGTSWVVSFADAPPGVYTFVDLSQNTRGTITVDPPPIEDQ